MEFNGFYTELTWDAKRSHLAPRPASDRLVGAMGGEEGGWF